jgi:ArsR family transcriptional regulator
MSRLTGEEFAAIAKAVSDPTRYTILRHIADSSDCTCVELRDASAITAATLSHHLRELEAAGLIKIARRGKFAHPAFCRETWNRYIAQLSTL